VILVPGQDEPIEVKVVEVRGNRVRLGIAAKPDVLVHRKEIHQDIVDKTGRAGPRQHRDA
jgi:carbon storage regulator CsrA